LAHRCDGERALRSRSVGVPGSWGFTADDEIFAHMKQYVVSWEIMNGHPSLFVSCRACWPVA
jgi:hypothetical protein